MSNCRIKGILHERLTARFVEMFGDPIENNYGWPVHALLELGNCKNGMNFSDKDSGVEIHCLGVSDFKDLSVIHRTDELDLISLNKMPDKEYLLRNGDIVFVRSNGNKDLVGRSVAVYPGDIPTTFSGFCIRFRRESSEVETPYLLQFFKNQSIRKKMQGRGANIQNLNQKILGSLSVPIPPHELQEQFAAFIAQVDKSKVAVQRSLAETPELFDRLIQKVL